ESAAADGQGWFDHPDRVECRHYRRPGIHRLQCEQGGRTQPRADLGGGPEGHRHPGQRAVAWGGSDRTRQGSARRGRAEHLRRDNCAPAHGRSGGGCGGGCLSRVVGQQLHDRQRGRRRRRPGTTLTHLAPAGHSSDPTMLTSMKENEMNQSLKGKTALVTGASRGIGRAVAERLAKDGATVALTYNASKSGADEAVAAIEKAGGTAFAIHADLVDPATVPALFKRLDDEVTRRNGSKVLDILVNNAGNAGWLGFKDATPDSWDTMIAVYARAPFFIVQAALDRLADGASIINISSAAATKPMAAAPIYSMAKAAINTLTHALASELGPRGITVNAVAPGYTRTDANAAFRENPELVEAVEAQIALGRFGEPSEIAAVVAFLASDEGHWVTGQTIEASGGYKL